MLAAVKAPLLSGFCSSRASDTVEIRKRHPLPSRGLTVVVVGIDDIRVVKTPDPDLHWLDAASLFYQALAANGVADASLSIQKPILDKTQA